jgi:hypothetical protein
MDLEAPRKSVKRSKNNDSKRIYREDFNEYYLGEEDLRNSELIGFAEDR